MSFADRDRDCTYEDSASAGRGTAPTPSCPGAAGLQPAAWWVASALAAALGRQWIRRPIRSIEENKAKKI